MTSLPDDVSFHGATLDELPFDKLRHTLATRHVLKVSGLFTADEILRAREIIAKGFRRGDDRAHDPADSDAIKQNYQKLSVGGVGSKNVFRVMRTFFNPIWAPDTYGMRDIFVRLSRFRNRLYDLHENFAIEKIEDQMWTAARVHQYPVGGGCMAMHHDYLPAHASESLRAYAQVYLPMTQKGVDFQTGGAFIMQDDKVVHYEDACRLGDVLVYDGRIEHGVSDVDPLRLLDLDKFGGRIAAFVTLYKDLSASNESYDKFSKDALAT